MPNARRCPVCENERGRVMNMLQNRDAYRFACPVCGDFGVTTEALNFKGKLPSTRYLLSAYLRANPGFLLTSPVLSDPALLGLRVLSVEERACALLAELVRRSEEFGAKVVLDVTADWPLFFAKSATEAQCLCEYMVERGWVVDLTTDLPDATFKLTASGWSEAERSRHKQAKGNRAFVAMWFDDETRDVYTDGVKAALEDCGYSVVRVDEVQHVEKICDRILAELRLANLVVADFTGNRGGVYFEAGFAMGLGTPVIWTCRKSEIGKVHFDTRQYNHIVWESPSELREALQARVEGLCPADMGYA